MKRNRLAPDLQIVIDQLVARTTAALVDEDVMEGNDEWKASAGMEEGPQSRKFLR